MGVSVLTSIKTSTYTMVCKVALVFGLQAVVAALAAPSFTDVSDGGSSDCGKFVVDRCYKGPSTLKFPFETEFSTDVSDCQFYCDIIYKDYCSFFLFDRKENQCQFWNITLAAYQGTCDRVGGPKTIVPSEKSTTCKDDKCFAFENAMCIFEGNVLEHFTLIDSEETCQKVCDHMPLCKYYVYDKETRDCDVRDSDKFNCDILRGTKGSVDYKASNCDSNDNPTTKQAPTTIKPSTIKPDPATTTKPTTIKPDPATTTTTTKPTPAPTEPTTIKPKPTTTAKPKPTATTPSSTTTKKA